MNSQSPPNDPHLTNLQGSQESEATPTQDFTLFPTQGTADPFRTTATGIGKISQPFPQTIPGYEILPEIARGGMGIVYAARDLTFDREVAIKVMKPGMSARIFNREARIAARLPHPGIPPVHALGTMPDGLPFLVMKLVRGETLDRLLDKRKNLNFESGKFLAAFEQMCQAVGYAHSQGIIHRDLKPQNVMIGAFGEVQVMDWGLARDLASGPVEEGESVPTTEHSSGDSALSYAGQVKGTPAFMAPEQARGEPVDARCDVFALGGILAAILTGHPPFAGDTVVQTLAKAAAADLGDAVNRLKTCGAESDLIALCQSCLAAKPENRPENGVVLATLVAGYRSEVEERLKQAEMERIRVKEERKRRRIQWGLVTAVVLLLVTGGLGAVAASLWRTADVNRAEAEVQRDTANRSNGEAVEAKKVAEKAQAGESQAREKLAVFEYGGTMRVAHQEWRDKNLEAQRALLDSTDPKLRGWEWRYLDRLYDPSLVTLKGHKRSIRAASFNSESNLVVTGSTDNTAKVWDARTGAELLTLKGHTDGVLAVSFSQDNKRVVTGSKDNTTKVWNAQTGTEQLTLKGHTNKIFAVSFSADTTGIVTGSLDETAKVWDAKTGAELLTLKGHTSAVTAAAFSADGTRIVTGSWDKTAKIWDAKTGAGLLTLKGHASSLTLVSFSRDGKRVVTGSGDGSAKVWDAHSGGDLLTLKGHSGPLTGASFNLDGTRVVTRSTDQMTRVWDARSGAQLLSLKSQTTGVSISTLSPNGTRIVTEKSPDNTAKIWDGRYSAEFFTLNEETIHLFVGSFSEDGNRIVTGGGFGKTAKVWDARSGEELLILKGHKDVVFTASFSEDGKRIVTGSMDKTARVWDAKTGAELLSLNGHPGDVFAASFSADGSRILTGSGIPGQTYNAWLSMKEKERLTMSDNQTAKVWDAITGKELFSLNGHPGGVFAAMFSTDGSRIVTGGFDNSAKVWDANTGAELLTLQGHTGYVRAAMFSRDGNRILTGSNDGTAKVWDAKTGAVLLTLKGHTSYVSAAAFSRDGNRIITGGFDDTAKVWDAKTGAELLTLKGAIGNIIGASFSSDGTRILTSANTARIWDSRPFAETIAEREAAFATKKARPIPAKK